MSENALANSSTAADLITPETLCDMGLRFYPIDSAKDVIWDSSDESTDVAAKRTIQDDDGETEDERLLSRHSNNKVKLTHPSQVVATGSNLTGILSLPTELLVQVFEHSVFVAQDAWLGFRMVTAGRKPLKRIKSVCKQFAVAADHVLCTRVQHYIGPSANHLKQVITKQPRMAMQVWNLSICMSNSLDGRISTAFTSLRTLALCFKRYSQDTPRANMRQQIWDVVVNVPRLSQLVFITPLPMIWYDSGKSWLEVLTQELQDHIRTHGRPYAHLERCGHAIHGIMRAVQRELVMVLTLEMGPI
ncbi:hypothetical protein MMC25_003228 [Agyrium rufum]|nr:hypothetical protein [Agyrium rufum]